MTSSAHSCSVLHCLHFSGGDITGRSNEVPQERSNKAESSCQAQGTHPTEMTCDPGREDGSNNAADDRPGIHGSRYGGRVFRKNLYGRREIAADGKVNSASG